MKKSFYDYYAERQTKISHLSRAKTILFNLGLVLAVFSLIVLAIIYLAEARESNLTRTLHICAGLSLACFLSAMLVNLKVRELRSKKRHRIKVP